MIEVLWIMILTSLACGILGPFLVMLNLSMTADALSHSVLLGIVLAFFVVRDLNSPVLFLMAVIFAILTVLVVEWLSHRNRLAKEDALAFVFPCFFSIAVVLISYFFRNAHLDVDIVLMGNPLFAPFIRWGLFPKSMILLSLLFLVNAGFVFLFFQEFKMLCFDREFSSLKGIPQKNLFYVLIVLTSLTIVLSFDSVGAILVISYLVTPVGIALLWTRRFRETVFLSLIVGILISVVGYYLGIYWNVSLTGLSSAIGFLFCFISILFYKKGVIWTCIKKVKDKKMVQENLILCHLHHHPDCPEEIGMDTICSHLNWTRDKTDWYLSRLQKKGLIDVDWSRKVYLLTSKGEKHVTLLLGNLYDKQS